MIRLLSASLAGLVLACCGLSAWAQAPAPTPGDEPAGIPTVVLDESSPDWVVEPFAGNWSAGQQAFFDGPRLQVGGLGTPNRVIETADGTVYFRSKVGVIKVTPEGTVRMILKDTGKLEGPADQVAAGDIAWNAADKSLYLAGPNCIRRLFEKPDGTRWVEVVAGTPGKAGQADGPARQATIASLRLATTWNNQSLCDTFMCTSKGTLYFNDGGIRKLENGTITTIAKGIGFQAYDEETDTFFVRGPTAFSGAVYNPKTRQPPTRVFGMLPPQWRKGGYPADTIGFRYGKNCDGPALTHVTFNSNFAHCTWDPYHKALWVYGPDERRARWFKDGQVKTVLDEKQLQLPWARVVGVSPRGYIYIVSSGNPTGVFRAYNKKEVKP